MNLKRVWRYWLRDPLFDHRVTVRSLPSLVATLRRPRRMYDLGCTLLLKRPRGWEARSRRAFLFVIRALSPGDQACPSAERELAQRAHDVIRQKMEPVRRLGVAAWITGTGAALLLGLVTLAACAISSTVRGIVFPENLARTATWLVSSTVEGMPQSGTGAFGTKPFFHSNNELNPHIDLDFGREVTIRRVEIENRSDCCELRALPLNVEVPDGADYRLLCQRRAPFSSWTCRTEPVRTRLLRVSHPGVGILHLNSIEVFE